MKHKNLATILIPKQELKDFIKKEIKKEGSESNNKTSKTRTVLTVESLISQIINKFIVTKNNPMFGLSDLYKLDENTNTVVAVNDDSKEQKTALQKKLHQIYYGKPYNSKNDITFKVPSIRMTFDSLNSDSIDSKKSKTILRISIYDQNDTPFDSISNILEKLYLKDFNKSINSINKIKRNFGNTGSQTLYFDKITKELKQLEEQGFLKVVNGKYIFDPLKKENDGSSIKEFYKKLFPSLTYGTQHTSILSANVSTVNENKLNTVYITRSDRNNQSELNSRIKPDLPLRVMPTQASLEIFGCPWINFGQFIFLDFDTGTTIDNKYAVTGITHNLSPGNFKTSLTLSYGDVYGQYEAAADSIEYVTSQLNVSKKNKETISTKNNNVKFTARDDIVIFGMLKDEKKGTQIFTDSSYFESRLNSIDNQITQQIKFINPMYEDNFKNYSNLLVFNNSFLLKFIKSEDILKNKKQSPDSFFVTDFGEFLKKNKESVLNTVILSNSDPKEDKFTFNIIKPLQKRKPKKLIISQKSNSFNAVLVRNPINLAAKNNDEITSLNNIDYNNTAFNQIKNLKSIYENISLDNVKKAVFNKSFEQYYDILENIDKAHKVNGGILSLRVQTFTLNDIFSDQFLKANEDKINFLGMRRGETNRGLTEADIVKITYSTQGNQSSRRSAMTVKDAEIKLERLASLKNSRDTSISKVEYNIDKLKKIIISTNNFANVLKSLTSYQSFSIFKKLIVRYGSEATLAILNQSNKRIDVNQQSGQTYYDVSLDFKELKRLYDNTNIIDIHVEENETQGAKLVITEESISASGFVEYNEQTSRFINIFPVDFDIISIFNKNYVDVERKKIKNIKTGNIENKFLKFVSRGINKGFIKSTKINKKTADQDIAAERKDDNIQNSSLTRLDLNYNKENSSFSPVEDNIINNRETLVHEIQISEIVNFLKKQNSDYLESGHELYTHSNKKILGINMTEKSRLGGNIYVNKGKKKNSKSYNIYAQNSDGQSAINWSWNPTKNNNLDKINKQIKVEEKTYREIKESNLPAVNKNALNLKVMEKWVPIPETTSSPDTQEVDIESVDPVDYTSITNNFKSQDLETIRQELNKNFFDNINKSHVDFESVLTKKFVAGQAYLDYKISDLTISEATPDQEGIKGTLAKISYSKYIAKNNSKISITRQRRTKIQPSLYYLLYAAAEYVLTMKDSNNNKKFENAFENLFIRTGGDIPLYLKTSRNLSKTIRHDGGYAADIMLIKKNGKALRLKKSKPSKSLTAGEIRENEIIWTFLKACKELGATGIGADYDYDDGKAFHIDIAKLNPDFSNGVGSDGKPNSKYRRTFKIQPTGSFLRAIKNNPKLQKHLDKDGNFIMTQSMVTSSTNNIMNARYWGKRDGSKASYRAEAAPPNLKAIFNGKIT